jgi:hypothetical protein
MPDSRRSAGAGAPFELAAGHRHELCAFRGDAALSQQPNQTYVVGKELSAQVNTREGQGRRFQQH